MARYRVVMTQTIVEKAIVYVDAKSVEEAEQKAVDRATKWEEQINPIDWKFDETYGDIDADAELAEDKVA